MRAFDDYTKRKLIEQFNDVFQNLSFTTKEAKHRKSEVQNKTKLPSN